MVRFLGEGGKKRVYLAHDTMNRLGLAEVAFATAGPDGAPGPEAQAHLDFAIAEFQEMKMQPALERALRHKGLLHA